MVLPPGDCYNKSKGGIIMKKLLALAAAVFMALTVGTAVSAAGTPGAIDARPQFSYTLTGKKATIRNRDGATLILDSVLKVTEQAGHLTVYTLPEPAYQVDANSFAVFLADSGAFNSAPASRYRIFEWNADGTRGKPTGEILTTAQLRERGIVAECNPTTEDKHWEILPDHSKGTLQGLYGRYYIQLSNRSIFASDNRDVGGGITIKTVSSETDSQLADVVRTISVDEHHQWAYLSNGRWQYWEVYGAEVYPISGWEKINGKWYYFYPYSDGEGEYSRGDMVTGWAKSGPSLNWDPTKVSGQYYLQADGSLKTGWVKRDKDWYYVDPETLWCRTGWFKDTDGKWYYLSPETGKMHTSWIWDNGKWYYCGWDGSICQDGWYPTIAPKEGVVLLGNWSGFHYFRPDGAMAVGWQKIDHYWYYLNADGSRYNGWLLWKDKWYYLKDGVMQRSTTVDGYWLNGFGVWVP